MPGAKQAWPTVAACWSPAMPVIGSGAPNSVGGGGRRTARCSRGPRAAPRAGCSRRRRRSSSQSCRWMSKSIVREALVASVACTAAAGQPPEQEAVDRAEGELAALGRGARARHLVEQPGELGGREVGVDRRGRCAPGRSGSWPSATSSRQRAAVRRSCQTIARWTGAPGRALPEHRGLALVGDADRGDLAPRRGRPRRARSRQTASVSRQISSGSCSTQPALRVVLLAARAARCATGTAVAVEQDRPACSWCPGRSRAHAAGVIAGSSLILGPTLPASAPAGQVTDRRIRVKSPAGHEPASPNCSVALDKHPHATL